MVESKPRSSIFRSLKLVIYVIALIAVIPMLFQKSYPVHKEGIVVVTGASTGIGRHAAEHLASSGYTVYCGVRKQSDAAKIQALNNARMIPLIMDVTDHDLLVQAVATVKSELEKTKLPLVAIVNNAGISRQLVAEFHDMDDAKRVFDTNVFGVMALTQMTLPLLRESQGRIVMISSLAGSVVYAASKFALEGYSDGLRREVAGFNISVSVVKPAYVKTPIFERGDTASAQVYEEDNTQEEVKRLYPSLVNEAAQHKRQKMLELASDPIVTSEAILHAVSSPKPKTRYVVANVNGIRADILEWVIWALPDRIIDRMYAAKEKAFALTSTQHEHQKKGPYIKPPSEYRTKSAAPSIKVVAQGSDAAEMTGRTIEGYSIDDIRLHHLDSLRDEFPSSNVSNIARQKVSPITGMPMHYSQLLGDDDIILADIVRKQTKRSVCEAFVRAGPRKTLHFDPRKVRAAIVTCGGLCPGLNNVIREIVHSLFNLYDVEKVLGIRGGFNGMTNPSYSTIDLTDESVSDCHHQGGSILGSARGGFDLDKMISFLVENRINQLYVIGGDGTHRGAMALSQECLKRKLNIAVAGIPKTIDNDVDLIDRSFGFQTAVEAAQAAIQSAKIEARCNIPNGVGVVKLMGRSAGFIAVHACLGSGDIDLCLVPEIPIVLEGENGYLPFLLRRVLEKGHAVVVVAEGAGEELLGESAEKDAGGNKKLPPVGEFIRDKIQQYFEAQGEPATVKYINPSYMIRSVPANASDAMYCMLLAQNAVHGVMAGFTAFTTGLVNNRMVYIPIKRIVATSPRVLDPQGRTWERVLAETMQPQHQLELKYDEISTSDR